MRNIYYDTRLYMSQLDINIDLQLFNKPAQEKTELPSHRKLLKAREKGQIFKSKDIIDNVTLLIALFSLRLLSTYISYEFSNFFKKILISFELHSMGLKNITTIIQLALLALVKISLPFLFIILLAGLIANISQVGFLYSSEPLKFSLEKVNPLSGLKRIFSKKSLLEIFKIFIKFLIIILFLFLDFSNKIISSNMLISLELDTSVSLMLNEIFMCLMKISAILFLLSFVDYYFQKKFYIKEMKMTKQEVKDEFKQMEGDPYIKGKIKEKQRELTMNTLMTSTREATVIVTNPTHLSVGIDWKQGMFAPKITIMGSDSVAMKIREIATENNIPIFEHIPLARTLYNECEIGEYIPNEYWSLVAQVLTYVLNLSK